MVVNELVENVLAVYCREGRVYSVEVQEGRCTKVMDAEGAAKGHRIVWCAWHELGVTGRHLLVLTSAGLLCLVNTAAAPGGRVEQRLRIRSPEDYSLRSTSAALQQEILWVGMENGDMLAISPVLPFPCSVASVASIQRRLRLSPSVSEAAKAEKFCLALQSKLSETPSGITIIARPPHPYHLKSPLIRGPLLLQPEPERAVGAVQLICPFVILGVELVAVTSQRAGHLDLYLLETPILPAWKDDAVVAAPSEQRRADPFKEGGDGDESPRLSLTLVETVVVPERIQRIVPHGHRGLLLTGERSVMLVTLRWLDNLAALLGTRGGADPDLAESQLQLVSALEILWTAASPTHPPIAATAIVGNMLSIWMGDGTRVQVPLEEESAIETTSLLGRHPEFTRPLPIPSLPSRCVPESCSRRIKLAIPKLSDKLKRAIFPTDLDEDILEEVARVIFTWRSEAIAGCNRLGEEADYLCQALGELAAKQEEWAARTTRLAEPLKGAADGEDSEISRLEATSARCAERLATARLEGGQDRRASELVDRLQKLRHTTSRLLAEGPADGRASEAERWSQLRTGLERQRAFIDQIHDRLARLSIMEESKDAGQDDGNSSASSVSGEEESEEGDQDDDNFGEETPEDYHYLSADD